MTAAFHDEGSCSLMFYAVIRSLRFKRLSMPAKRAAWAGPAFYTKLDTLPHRLQRVPEEYAECFAILGDLREFVRAVGELL